MAETAAAAAEVDRRVSGTADRRQHADVSGQVLNMLRELTAEVRRMRITQQQQAEVLSSVLSETEGGTRYIRVRSINATNTVAVAVQPLGGGRV